MTSFYISRLNSHTTEMDVSKLFLEFGEVHQIEFILPNTKSGFKENDDVKAALIHMSDLTPKGLHLVHSISNGEDYKLYVKDMEYLSISFADPKIQNTSMNNEQNIENCSYLEAKIEAQEKTIAELIKRVNNTEILLYQLVGGLFNSQTQLAALNDHVTTIFPNDLSEFLGEDTSKWMNFPTTRQGDDTEQRVEELENVVKKLINDLFEPDNSVSTHSSMPSLVDVDSVSTHSSMPSLVDVDSGSTHSSMPSLVDDDDNSTQSSLTWLEDDYSNSSIPPLIDEHGNIIE